MTKKLTAFLLSAAAFFAGAAVFAQSPSMAPDNSAEWKISSEQIGENLYRIMFTGTIVPGWHIYSTTSEPNPTEVEFSELSGAVLEGTLTEVSETADFDGEKGFAGTAVLSQDVRLTSESAVIKGTIFWQACADKFCSAPEDFDFSLNIGTTAAHQSAIVDPEEDEGSSGSLWALILEAILWGFAMLLTPCVFPMVPMTVSFFLKSAATPAAGRFKAFIYGLFIILLYTVPISAIIIATRIVGGEAVTADIFNWLATHWIPNIIFFIVFMIFAASFFGAFEITLPSSLVNKSDAKSDGKGLAGVFFMALTLVLVSFSCTGPIVGSVLIKSTQGEFWTPMITMFAFSAAFALPFTVLAMFPSLLKKMRSGSWLNSVKVVLGFVEVALGLKFLSVADQTYHWGLLDREVYLAIWITVFSLLGLYLLGKLQFSHDEKPEHLSVFRLSLAIAVFSFVVYLIPGMFGAPLKALSGYLPPIETQDFVLGSNTAPAAAARPAAKSGGLDIKLPHGLSGYYTLEDAMEASKATGKPIFVDITGHGCVNCREMEARVWSDAKVLEMLRDDFVILSLFTDDKTKLPESEWITTESGKVLKDVGRVNSYIARTMFNVNAQPNYTVLDSDGHQLIPVRGYNLSVDGYVDFLQSGLDAFKGE